ncbi:MAG TPA: hypothetical protein VF638_14440 [Sphingomonas sp.]|jgi:hypothetical protein
MANQHLRNELTAIEDRARQMRNETANDGGVIILAGLIAALTQLVREELVK